MSAEDAPKINCHHVSRLWDFSVSRRGYKVMFKFIVLLDDAGDIMSLALPSHRGHDYFTSLCTEGRAGCVIYMLLESDAKKAKEQKRQNHYR